MSIANELSSDVAVAILSMPDAQTTVTTQNLTNIVMQIHTTMRDLKRQARQLRRPAFITATERASAPNAH